jgi:hypothetical protein
VELTLVQIPDVETAGDRDVNPRYFISLCIAAKRHLPNLRVVRAYNIDRHGAQKVTKQLEQRCEQLDDNMKSMILFAKTRRNEIIDEACPDEASYLRILRSAGRIPAVYSRLLQSLGQRFGETASIVEKFFYELGPASPIRRDPVTVLRIHCHMLIQKRLEDLTAIQRIQDELRCRIRKLVEDFTTCDKIDTAGGVELPVMQKTGPCRRLQLIFLKFVCTFDFRMETLCTSFSLYFIGCYFDLFLNSCSTTF